LTVDLIALSLITKCAHACHYYYEAEMSDSSGPIIRPPGSRVKAT